MWLIQGQATEKEALFFADVLEPLCISVSCYEEAEGSLWCFEGLVETLPELSVFQEKIQQAGETHLFKAPHLTHHFLPKCDWLEENYKAFPPLQVGPFYFYGSHHKDPAPTGTYPLWIDAATAFGSGHHASTTGCLKFLPTCIHETLSQKILDLGCGSGILAMATACLAPKAFILALDNDPEAVRVSQENIKRNHFEKRITVRKSEGFTDLPPTMSFDIIIANILAQPLIDLAREMASFIKPRGEIILSGFLEEQAGPVRSQYEKHAFQFVSQRKENGWTTLKLRHTKDPT